MVNSSGVLLGEPHATPVPVREFDRKISMRELQASPSGEGQEPHV
jgi:hypothetical protein